MLIILLIIIRSAVLDVIVKGDNFLQIHRCFSGMLKKRQHFFVVWTNAAQLHIFFTEHKSFNIVKMLFLFQFKYFLIYKVGPVFFPFYF